MSVQANSSTQQTKITPSMRPQRTVAQPVEEIRVGANLGGIGADLRAVTASTESREQLIDRFTDLAVQRSALLCCGWVEIESGDEPQLLKQKYSNPSLNNDNVRKQMLVAAEMAASGQRVQVIPSEKVRGAAVVSIPFFVDEATTGVLVGLTHNSKQNCAESLLVCQIVATHYDMWRSRDQLTEMAFEVRSTATILELMGKAQCSKTVKEACYVIANELKDLFRCDYVAIGLRKAGKRGCNLAALSGMSEFDRESRTTILFCSCFDEAITRGKYTVFPARNTVERNATLSHKKLAGNMRTESAITIPLKNEEDELIGAITILGNRFIDRNESTRNLIKALEHPMGSSVGVIQYAEGGWVRKLGRFIVSGEKTKVTYALLALSLLSLIAMFVPVPYRVHAKCIAEPVVRRTSVAPHDGLLENTFVEPGDVVTKGQLLAQMDGREIGFKKAAIVADQFQAMKKRDSHRANQQIADMMMAELERNKLKAETDILQQRETNLEITSPIDGIILSGSIDRRENYPVTVGQALYEIAPLHPLRVEIAIPADEVMHIEPGQSVKFRFDGFGTQTNEGIVEKIRPSTTIRNDENVFIAEAIVNNEDGAIRPGMSGNARVYGQRKTLGWSLFHRPWERFVTAIGL